MTVADGVEKAVYGGPERAQAHQIGVDDIDADLDADQIGRDVAHRARGERIQQGRATHAKVDQFHAGAGSRQRGPGAGGVKCVGAVADGAAVM